MSPCLVVLGLILQPVQVRNVRFDLKRRQMEELDAKIMSQAVSSFLSARSSSQRILLTDSLSLCLFVAMWQLLIEVVAAIGASLHFRLVLASVPPLTLAASTRHK